MLITSSEILNVCSGAGKLPCLVSSIYAAKASFITSPTFANCFTNLGAGSGCDGQILVYQDMLGMVSDFTPKFVKQSQMLLLLQQLLPLQ